MNLKSNLHQLLNNWNFLAALWLILNLLQAYFTTLIDDEAYYWMYSRQLDWGYFDHPPMVAVFIKAGYAIFENEVGVRLLTVLAQLAMLRVLWELIAHPEKKKHASLFFLIAFSLPMLQVYGIFTTPDVPLLLFGSLTLLAYQRFNKNDNFLNILIFSLCAAALMYSKYHGALLLVFIILSNLKLLFRPTFYLVGILALVLYAPHLYWQYSNDFPSFQYHLTDRVTVREWWFVPEYLLNQVAIYNPLLWLVIVPLLKNDIVKFFTSKSQLPDFHRTLYFIAFGFLIFFFLVSLRFRHIEPQWTVLIVFPIIILAFEKAIIRPVFIKKIKRISWISVGLLLAFRLLLAFPIFNFPAPLHETQKNVKSVEKLAKGAPVIYLNSYQQASLHAFYAKNKYANCLNTSRAWRDNQYSNWFLNTAIHEQDILIVNASKKFNYSKPFILPNGKTIYYRPVKKYFNIAKVKISLATTLPQPLIAKDTISVQLRIQNPYDYDIPIDNWAIFATYGKGRDSKTHLPLKVKNMPKTLSAKSEIQVDGRTVLPKKADKCRLSWALRKRCLAEIVPR